MPTTTVKTIGTGGDYTTLQAWEDASPANLVTADEIWQGQCKNQSFTGSGTLLSVAGSTTDATRYKELTTEAGASFVHNANVRTNALRYNTANGAAISSTVEYGSVIVSTEGYFRLTGLQVAGTHAGGYRALDITGSGSIVNRCILETISGGTNAGRQVASLGGGAEVLNSLLVNRASSAADNLIDAAGACTLRNCTIVSTVATATHSFRNNYATITLSNVALFNATNANASNGTTNKTNCYTDASASNTGWNITTYDTSTGSGFESITDGSHDFRLKSGSALKDAGSTDATAGADISNTSRPQGASYDVGCWESAATGVTGTLARTNANDTSAASGTTTVNGSLARTNANDTSVASGATTVLGTLARTNANDTSAASGSVGGGSVSGTLAYTNANDTSAAAGTPTVNGALARTNFNDTAAAAGWAGTISGTLATTNANDTAAASGVVGIAIPGLSGAPSWHTRIGDRVVRGSKREIEELLRQLARQHAEEDEERIEQAEPAKKRAVRVVGPGRAKVVETATAAVTVAPPILQSAGITAAQASAVYEQAYVAHMHREAIRQDDEDIEGVIEHVSKRRASAGLALLQQIEALKAML